MGYIFFHIGTKTLYKVIFPGTAKLHSENMKNSFSFHGSFRTINNIYLNLITKIYYNYHVADMVSPIFKNRGAETKNLLLYVGAAHIYSFECNFAFFYREKKSFAYGEIRNIIAAESV